jgi:predicted nucleic acid-binding Zn ribbon protein
MKHRKNIKEAAHIGSVINKVLRTCRYESDEDLAQVWSLWASAVGEDIAKNARPEAFKGKLLLVHVTSSAWMQQLQFLKKDIINKVNDALGNTLIEEIKFKIGPV